MIDDGLANLKRLVPKGKWKFDERTITPADGKAIQCSSEEMTPVELKIVLEFISTLVNQYSQMEEEHRWALQNVEIQKNELKRYQGNSLYWKQRGYIQALTEIIDYVVNKSYTSVKVRDAFQELLNLLEEKKRKKHRVTIENE